MGRIAEYKILEAQTACGLQKQVIKRLVAGWQLVGGVSVATALGPTGQYYHTVYCQAMVLEDDLAFHMVKVEVEDRDALPDQAPHR